jgi:ABC-type multidrug transport system fused ATPase/permease subunit
MQTLCCGRASAPSEAEKERFRATLATHPFDRKWLPQLLSLVTFGWLSSTVSQGSRRQLDALDLFAVPLFDRAERATDRLEQCWRDQLAHEEKKKKKKKKRRQARQATDSTAAADDDDDSEERRRGENGSAETSVSGESISRTNDEERRGGERESVMDENRTHRTETPLSSHSFLRTCCWAWLSGWSLSVFVFAIEAVILLVSPYLLGKLVELLPQGESRVLLLSSLSPSLLLFFFSSLSYLSLFSFCMWCVCAL